jgi:hypothetical protein
LFLIPFSSFFINFASIFIFNTSSLKFIHHSLYLSLKSFISQPSLFTSSLHCVSLFSHYSFVSTILIFITNSQPSSPQTSCLFLLSSSYFLVLLFILFNLYPI